MAVTSTQVESLYLAYFGRPAEPAGLAYWTSQTNATVDQISASFAQQPEYTSVYGGLTRAQTINQLYQNLFGRTASSTELTYWQNSTDITVDRMALALTNGATGTDRLLLDGKTQFATAATANLSSTATASDAKAALTGAQIITAVSNTGSATTQSLSAYLAASTSNTAANFYQQVAVQVANQSKVAVNGALFADGNGVAISGGANFKDATSGVISLNNVQSTVTNGTTNPIAVSLASANKATDLTLSGTSGVATGGTAGNAVLTLTEASSTKIVNTLHLNVSDSAVANTSTGFDVSGLTSLTTIDGANSTTGLTINSTGLANLANVTTGSGADVLTVATTATNAVAQTVNSGAGNDTIGATVGTAALTINGGAGVDTITANVTSTSAAVLTINAGDGNDIINVVDAFSSATATHGLQITLGAGNDTVNLNTLTNVGTVNLGSAAGITAANASLAANTVKVTDFSATGDVLHLVANSVYTVLNNTQAANVSGSASLAEAANAAIQAAHGNNANATATSFAFGGNTYVALDASAGGSLNSGDGLIELTGFTGTLTQGTNLTIG
ncbi:beta strand repeat-containing protein [Pseudomonas rhizoryzae]|uniref:beta strand repeat-containing protein n=1 Tax=Pseudomonas rhizoryzae TaxID=2571129 RepID=UPI0010C224A7|nr:DUF4214 domain-containing protein [Pseudomonas rhizoryzae]